MDPLTLNDRPIDRPRASGLRLRLDSARADEMAALFKAISHPVRLQILDLISQGGGELCGCDIEPHFDLTQPTISHHLKALREVGLITSEPYRSSMYHRVNPAKMELLRDVLTLLQRA
ncbi:MAG: helix-turn-helix transcriptional regulator [Anaerolineae bacterium]|nr:helix-turn-helix transcriptional regulator [Anaerolineae bacterium]